MNTAFGSSRPINWVKRRYRPVVDPAGVPVAVTQICPMQGSGSKAQLILFDDGRKYVVKFKGNIQGPRVLPNELIASRLAMLLGVPVGEFEVVRVPQMFIDFEPDMARRPFVGGLQFGSLFYEKAVASPTQTRLEKLNNPSLLGSIVVFDHLINNWDRSCHGDNVLLIEDTPPRLLLIDHGHAFMGPEWTVEELRQNALPVKPLFGNFYRIMAPLLIGDVFSESLERVESLQREHLESIMVDIPLDWGIYEEEQSALIDFILTRKGQVRETINRLSRKRFPKTCDDYIESFVI
ncbi:MAG: HipA family kinase [Bacillota bacterium]|jgi:hypothetical protein